MKDKIINGTIVGILTIAGISVSVTSEDIEKQYKENTGKELTITQEDLVSFDEIIVSYKKLGAELKKIVNEIDCNNNEYDVVSSCSSYKDSLQEYINSLEGSVKCFNKINNSNDLEKNDLDYCINAMKDESNTILNFYNNTFGSCDIDCETELEGVNYNLAMFEAYLKKLKK